jgi:hypothetical protein
MEEPVPRLLSSAARLGLADRMRVVPEGQTAVFTPESLRERELAAQGAMSR